MSGDPVNGSADKPISAAAFRAIWLALCAALSGRPIESATSSQCRYLDHRPPSSPPGNRVPPSSRAEGAGQQTALFHVKQLERHRGDRYRWRGGGRARRQGKSLWPSNPSETRCSSGQHIPRSTNSEISVGIWPCARLMRPNTPVFRNIVPKRAIFLNQLQPARPCLSLNLVTSFNAQNQWWWRA